MLALNEVITCNLIFKTSLFLVLGWDFLFIGKNLVASIIIIIEKMNYLN
jgi:hypothetical protein